MANTFMAPALKVGLLLAMMVTIASRVEGIRVAPVSGGRVGTESNCTVSKATFPRLKFLTFYSWHTYDGNWTSTGQASDWQELVTYRHLTNRSSILEVFYIFFESIKVVNPKLQGFTLKKSWKEDWAHRASEVEKYVHDGTIEGFFLGDELVWNNITWDQLNETSAAIKARFPTAFVYYNEGGAPLYAQRNINGFRSPYPYVPFALDYVSTDDYDSMSIVKNPVWFYKKFLYPKMRKASQRAFVVPPVFVNSDIPKNVTADDWALEQARAYIRWIEEDDRLVGINGFYLTGKGGLLQLPKTLDCYQTLAAQMNKQ